MIYVKDLIEVCNGKLLCGDINLPLNNFSRDTRKIQRGDVYIGIKGETFDGNGFWRQALENGADCVIIQNIDFKERKKKSLKIEQL